MIEASMIIESMKANELRIGNYVRTYGQDVGHRTIVGITPEGVNLLEQDEKIDYNLIEPIPLTEEWLEKFGFEDYGYGRWEISDFKLIGGDKLGWDLNTGGIEPHIKYVHQLQNLYFALCGIELEIK